MVHRPRRQGSSTDPASADMGSVRIVGGTFRGRRLEYSGDLRTRPMKDRVRESLFNLLPDDLGGLAAFDLFAGTGVLALEAISRGAEQAICIEQHMPTAELIRRNARLLEIEDRVLVAPANTFLWIRRLAEGRLAAAELAPLKGPWLVFCSPPYAFYVERADEMQRMLARLVEAAPSGSRFVLEADDPAHIIASPLLEPWDIRTYPPAVLAFSKKP
ncbi:MAG: RsmD family RNA methyltransferase [Pirellulales bacterium]